MDKTNLYKQFRALGHKKDDCSNTIFELMLDAANYANKNDIVLDLGAGECRYKFFFEHSNYISLDFGKGDQTWNYTKLDIMGDITNPKFIKDNSVDLCLNTSTLEHLPEPFQFFDEIARILKPGGRLYLYVPFLIAEHQEPYDYFRYTRYGLEHISRKSGLKILKITPSNKPLQTAIRLLTGGIRLAKPQNYGVKVILKAFRLIFEWFVTPIFDYLDRFSMNDSSPLCWILIAEKEGERNNSMCQSPEGLLSILCCPDCKSELNNTNDKATCNKCGKTYTDTNQQISFE